MSRFNIWDMGFCGCVARVLVLCGTTPTAGATVTVKQAGATIASGTSDSTGYFSWSPAEGLSYVISATKTGVGSQTVTTVVLPGGVTSLNICPTVNCGPCGIPRSTLNVSWSNLGGSAGSGSLAFDGSSTWNMGCVPSTGGGISSMIGKVQCFGGIVQLQLTSYTDGGCTTLNTISTFTGSDAGVSYTCSPFHFTWTGSFAGSPTTITLTG